MRINRAVAALLGILTLAPWAFFIYLVARITSGAFPPVPAPNAPPEEFFREFNALFRFQMVFMLVMLALMVFYIVHVFRTDRVPQEKKALWAAVLFLGNLFAMPVYWYFYIWPTVDRGAA